MPVNLSIKNAPDELVAALKLRAQRNHRSMQREALAILEEAVRVPGRKTPDEILAEVRRLGLKTPAEAAKMIRADRDSR
jgi:plasmid stability protein